MRPPTASREGYEASCSFQRVSLNNAASLSDQLLDLSVKVVSQLPRSVRQQEDHGDDEYAEHGAGKPFRHALGEVRHQHDEGCAKDRSGQPADAADHHAEEQ